MDASSSSSTAPRTPNVFAGGGSSYGSRGSFPIMSASTALKASIGLSPMDAAASCPNAAGATVSNARSTMRRTMRERIVKRPVR